MSRIRVLIVVAALSLGLAFLGAYLAVVSQNPGPESKAPATSYGSLSP